MSYEEGLSSSDKKERLTTLKSLFNDPNINEKEKLNYLNKGLNDKHDLIRSKAVELLSEFKNESVFELLIKSLFGVLEFLFLVNLPKILIFGIQRNILKI